MLNPEKFLLETMSSDFRIYGYTPVSNVVQALEDVRRGYTSFQDFRHVMISGISHSLQNNLLHQSDTTKMRLTLGRLIRGCEVIYYESFGRLSRYTVIPSAR